MEIGGGGRYKGGFELGEARGDWFLVLQLLGGREAVTGFHVVGAVTIVMLHCISNLMKNTK